jgi:hypothetical protein
MSNINFEDISKFIRDDALGAPLLVLIGMLVGCLVEINGFNFLGELFIDNWRNDFLVLIFCHFEKIFIIVYLDTFVVMQ